MRNYGVFVEGLTDLNVDDIKPAIAEAAYQAINATADRSRTNSARNILRKLNFPATYLNPSKGRLAVTKRARQGDLEAIITARHRATSLAQFVTGGSAGRKGARVSIKRGSSVDLPGAFLMKLKSGTDSLDTKNNLGLAIRTRRGEKPRNAYKPVKVSDSLWLLYGPSVDQAFSYAAELEEKDALVYLEAEFNRQMERRNL